MERYNLAEITKLIYNSGFSLFTLKTLRDITRVKKESTLFRIIERLIEARVLLKLERNKYLLKEAKVSDFALANFLYSSSYVSFESALNFYGILSQFPYEISSATVKKSIKKKFEGKIFTYTHLKKELFFGYQKKENFLIALPEKALLDQLYLAGKGYKALNLKEYDLSRLKVTRLKEYLKKYPKTRQFKNVLNILRNYL